MQGIAQKNYTYMERLTSVAMVSTAEGMLSIQILQHQDTAERKKQWYSHCWVT